MSGGVVLIHRTLSHTASYSVSAGGEALFQQTVAQELVRIPATFCMRISIMILIAID